MAAALIPIVLCASLALGQNDFSPLTAHPQINEGQCGTSFSDQVLAQMVQNVGTMISGQELPTLPKSCMEIAENSPPSPSGYYAIEESPGNIVVKFCDMNNTYISPALTQYLDGLNSKLDWLNSNYIALTQYLDGLSSNMDGLNSSYIALTQYLDGLDSNYKSLSDKVDKLLNLHYPLSCEEILKTCPNCPNGIYQMQHQDPAQAKYVYCRMHNICGSGGWARVAYLDMTDPDQSCPFGWNTYTSGETRACGRTGTCNLCCISTTFSSPITYTQVCGRVNGYKHNSPDGTYLYYPDYLGIDGAYVDGVSLTKGSPRQHIWTFVAGADSNLAACPCADSPGPGSIPSFVGDSYFCESGSGTFPNNSIWDGSDCLSNELDCCKPPVPWFYRNITQPSIDYLELRVCADQGVYDEDIPISFYEIYVK